MNKYKSLTLIVVAIFSQIFALAQTDSLEKILASDVHDTLKLQVLTNLNWALLASNIKKSQEYANQELTLATQLNNQQYIAQAYNDLGIVCIKKSEFKKGLNWHQKALEIRLNLPSQLDIASSYSKIGYCYSEMDYFSLALANQLKALEIYKSMGDKVKTAYTLNNICFLYAALSNWDKVIELAKQSYEIAKELGDDYTMAVALNNIGSSFEEKKDYLSAIQFKLKALKLFQIEGDTSSMASMMNNIGYYYRNLNLDKLAEAYYLPGLALSTRQNDKNSMALFHSNLGALYTDKKEFSKALYHLNCAEKLAKEQELPSTLIPVYKHWGNFYLETGKPKLAKENFEKYTFLKDSLFNSEMSKQFTEMQTKYESNEKDTKNQLLEKENEISNAKLYKSKLIQWSLITGIILLTLVFYLLYSNYKIQQQQQLNKELRVQEQLRIKAVFDAEEKERQRIARDLHDGLGQRLSASKLNIAKLQQIIGSENKEHNLYLQNSIQLIDESVKDVRSISHNLMANGLLKSGLISAVREFINQINFSGKMNINIETVGLENRLDPMIENVLYRVLQEVVNNIIKHANASEVNIQFVRHEQDLNLIIEDNGVGFNPAKSLESGGIGLKNIQSRIAFINGKVDFDSFPGKGCTVNIDIPI